MPKRMHFSRRRKGITNYRKRLALLKSGVPRAVVRITNAKVMVQITDFSVKGDNVLAAATSSDLVGMGWKSSKTNIPASYLSGMLAAKRALKAGCCRLRKDGERLSMSTTKKSSMPSLFTSAMSTPIELAELIRQLRSATASKPPVRSLPHRLSGVQ